MKIYSFAPIADESCKVLILGTMPGVMSLKKQQYYGFERNAFWRIIYALFDQEPDNDYEMRRAFLLRHRIALWDWGRRVKGRAAVTAASGIPNPMTLKASMNGTGASGMFASTEVPPEGFMTALSERKAQGAISGSISIFHPQARHTHSPLRRSLKSGWCSKNCYIPWTTLLIHFFERILQ